MKLQEYSQADRFRRAGCLEQLYGVRALTVADGRGSGSALWEAESGGGLTVDVLPDNALDLGRVRYRGHNISFLAKNGFTSQYAYDLDGFNENFYAGMLYTCGLMNAGGGSVDGNTRHAPHGRIHNIASECRGYGVDAQKDQIVMQGRMREAALFGYALQVDRKVIIPVGGSSVTVEDVITNTTPDEIEYMLLYHFNFGYPFLSEDLTLEFPEGTVTTPRTPRAAEGMHEFWKFTAPQDHFPEQVYFHDLPADNAVVRAINPALGIGVSLAFDKANTPVLTQWKSMKSTDYALGLEPSNSFIMGRADERKNGTLKKMGGFESIRNRVTLTLFDL